MRKVILVMQMTLDGFSTGPNGEIDWFVYNKEIEKYGIELASTVDTTQGRSNKWLGSLTVKLPLFFGDQQRREKIEWEKSF